MSNSPTLPGQKRGHSKTAELPPPKRPQQLPPSTAGGSGRIHIPSYEFIYVVTTEEDDPDQDFERRTIGAYLSLQDANWRAIHLTREDSDDDEWDESYDRDGCAEFVREDLEGSTLVIKVERVALYDPGSEQKPEEILSLEDEENEGDEGDEEDEEDEEESDQGKPEVEDPYAETKAAQRGGRPRNMCKRSGCGAPLCDSCWPQTEGEWKDKPPPHTFREK